MARKKTKNSVKSNKPRKTTSKSTIKKDTKAKSKGKKSKHKEPTVDDGGIIVIEDDLQIDKNAELEARKAYLEEAKSQEAFD